MGRNQCSQFSVRTAFSEVRTSFLLAIWPSFRSPVLGKGGFRPPAGRPGQHFGHQKRDIIFGPLSKQWGDSFVVKPPPLRRRGGTRFFRFFQRGTLLTAPSGGKILPKPWVKPQCFLKKAGSLIMSPKHKGGYIYIHIQTHKRTTCCSVSAVTHHWKHTDQSVSSRLVTTSMLHMLHSIAA